MADLDYAKVVGRFALTAGDTTGDLDDDPDTIWCDEGRVIFTPLTTYAKVPGGVPEPFSVGNAQIEAEIDAEGYLTYLGKRYVHVVDLTSPKVNPQIGPGLATHRVTFNSVRANGTPVEFPEVTVRLTAAGDADGENDLTLVMPVTPGEATAIVQGPRGVGVDTMAVEGGDLLVTLDDATVVNAGALPVGPGGSDEGVASYLDVPSSATTAAARARIADDIETGTGPVASALSSSIGAKVASASPSAISGGGADFMTGYADCLFLSVGTSITAGFQPNVGDVPLWGFMHKAVVRDLGATLDNQAVDSSGIVWDGTRALSLGATAAELTAAGFDPAQSYETKVLGKDADLYIFDHGYNDRTFTIGTINDTTPATFYGAYSRVLDALLAEKPDAQIVFITPPSLYAPVGGGLNAGTVAVRDAILALGEKYAAPVLDMSTLAQINAAHAATLLPDTVHPSVQAHERMSRLLSAFIRYILPVTSTPAPDAGVVGVAHRWRAAEIVQNDGSAIQNWQPTNGAAILTQGTFAAQPLLKIESGVQMLRFDGTNDDMLPHIGLAAANLYTVTIVARVRPATATGEGIINLGTGAIQRGTSADEITDQLVALGGGTGASNTAVAVNPTSTTTFHVITMALGLDQDSNPVRQITIDGTSAAVNGDASPSTIRPGFGIGIYGEIDVLEIVTWPFALTTVQRAAVREAMRVAYPGIVA